MADLQGVMEGSAQWLFDHQDPTTGGWADQVGRPPSILNSAEVMIALLDGKAAPAGDARIQRAAQFLLGDRATEGQDRGAWYREVAGDPKGPRKIADMVRTSFAVEALVKAGRSVESDEVRSAVEWLFAIRNKDNGWAYSRGSASALMPTVFALMGLLEARRVDGRRSEEAITRSLDYLVRTYRKNDGSFGEASPLQAVHTIYAGLVIQAARKARLSVYSREEKTAIDWLLAHPDEARKLVEEEVTIDPANKGGNYGFLFVTDSLLIELLSNSAYSEHRRSTLAQDAMLGLKDRLDSSGGFYGYRVFSWSTAKVLSALSVASADYREFPTRRPEYTGRKAGNWVLGFAVLLSGFGVYLKVQSKFDVQVMVLFVFLMLAALLAYGKIGEKSFKELVKVDLGLLGGGKSAREPDKSDDD